MPSLKRSIFNSSLFFSASLLVIPAAVEAAVVSVIGDDIYTPLLDFEEDVLPIGTPDGIPDDLDGVTTSGGGTITQGSFGFGGGNNLSYNGNTGTSGDDAFGRVAVDFGSITLAEYNELVYAIQFDYRPLETVGSTGTSIANPNTFFLRADSGFEIQMGHGSRIRLNRENYGIVLQGDGGGGSRMTFGVTGSEAGIFKTDEWTRFALVHTGETTIDGASVWDIYAGPAGSELTLLGSFNGRQPSGVGGIPEEFFLGDIDFPGGSQTSGNFDNFQVGTFVIPEPGSMGLCGIGALMLLSRRRAA